MSTPPQRSSRLPASTPPMSQLPRVLLAPALSSARLARLQARLAEVDAELASLASSSTPYDGVTSVVAPRCQLPPAASHRFSLTFAR